MKAFCYVGSNSCNSVGEKLSLLIEDKLKRQGFMTHFYVGRDLNIDWCAGCLLCFKTGECPKAKEDYMGKIREEMRESDLIIWISPVYGANVSGLMKNYLDRITSWLHTFELAGKLGAVVSVSDNGVSAFPSYYLKKMLQLMGCNVIGEYKDASLNKKTQDEVAQEISKDIGDAVRNGRQHVSTEELENGFQHLKKVFTSVNENIRSSNAYEISYWHHIAEKRCESFNEFIELKNKESRGG